MRIRNIAICAIAVSLLGGSVVGAEELYQTFKGKKVPVTINGETISDGGLVIDGKTYIPLQSDAIQAMVQTDANGVHIHKPNVHISLFTSDKLIPFQSVVQGKWDFIVLAQIDNLKTKVHSIQVAIIDPNGEKVESQEMPLTDGKDAFWYTSSPIKMEFQKTGQYKVQLLMKQTKDGSYQLLAEKSVESKKKE